MADLQAGPIFKGALIGGAAAGVVNVALFFVGKAVGASFVSMQGGNEMEVPPFMPMFNCRLAAVFAAVVRGLLIRLTGEGAWVMLLRVAVAVCVL
jgi:hypothetical protein